MLDDPDVLHAVSTYRLVPTALPAMQHVGDLLGRGTGSSLEFQEYREYLPGDDVRHLDWAAYARTDSLMVRLYREETSPTLEVLLDASRSMSVSPGKERVARQLAAALLLWASQTGGSASIRWLGDETVQLRINELNQLSSRPFEGSKPLPAILPREFHSSRRHAVRVLISDFLFPNDPEHAIRTAAQTAGTLWVVQLLSGFEANPDALGGRRLIDIESGQESDLVLTPASIAEYKRRLTALQRVLNDACRRVHARLIVVVANKTLREICRNDLCAANLIEPD